MQNLKWEMILGYDLTFCSAWVWMHFWKSATCKTTAVEWWFEKVYGWGFHKNQDP